MQRKLRPLMMKICIIVKLAGTIQKQIKSLIRFIRFKFSNTEKKVLIFMGKYSRVTFF
ncbi:unknown protein [Cronobacter turicensis z3032]|uniref:Uncharacterized protein n=1 Tax=Cronobacter turicensis (strain DSM 18703 / CCUG 55852 / LMG 23827 / z3032) TaxID=693216 RepID=C9Y3H7_CROTZ|nr:unknown protein [Cronobacter turicensis z3032]